MPDTLPTIDPSTIAAVIEANLNAHLLSFARLPEAIVHDGPDSLWIDSGVASQVFNSVLVARFRPDAVDAQIEGVLSHFRRHARPVTWHVGPSTRPADLGRSLLAHGLTLSEEEPGMALEIDRLPEDAPMPPGLTIETVRDERGLVDWVDVWLFPLPADVRPFLLDPFRRRGLGDDLPWRFFVGRLGGEPVAISSIFVGEGVAAVHFVVTVPEVRRRGIGSAMTRHVLREARALGYRVAVLTASPLGIGSYRRLGFQEYCRIGRYEWSPNPVSMDAEGAA